MVAASMRPTDVLRGEHEHILRACAVLDAMAERVESGEQVSGPDAAAIVDFVRRYADGLHHSKEERVLFPALERAGMPRQSGPIAVMLLEHERGRDHLAMMHAALPSMESAENPVARESFAEGARGFAALLTQHIAKENNILFAMADRMLSAEDDAALLEAYAAREAEAQGTLGDKTTHETTLRALSARWL